MFCGRLFKSWDLLLGGETVKHRMDHESKGACNVSEMQILGLE